jgi:peptidoglycan-associated lipoprotein
MAAGLASLLALAACSKKKTDLSAGTGPGASAIPGSEQDFTVNVGDRVFFLEDQSTLTAEAQETLRRQAAWLQKYPAVTVQVEGHADERGTREYNIALSARRATATREFLIAQGVKGSRVSSIAYGKERPAALCDAEQCWSQNRRAVTVITGGAKTS